MALSCGAKCAKGVLITFNIIFWVSGGALICFGLYVHLEHETSSLFKLYEAEGVGYSHLQLLAFAFVGIGALVFLVGFFGCCGAIHENKCMLVSYFIFLFLVLGCELAVGILAVVFQDKGVTSMEKKMEDTIKTKYGVQEAITQAIDIAQAKFNCCGVLGSTDYQDSVWQGKQPDRKNVPITCCVLQPRQGTIPATATPAFLEQRPLNETLCQRGDAAHRHQTGCKFKMEEFLKEQSFLFMAIGCGISALEIFGMIFSICLCREI